MTKLEALTELAAKVETGGIEGKFDPWFERAFYKVSGTMAAVYWASDAYHGSLDAAKALHEAVLPGWDRIIGTHDVGDFEAGVADPLRVECFSAVDECMARAWLLAIIRALIAQEENK